MLAAALLLAISASSGPCELIPQKEVSELPIEATRRALIRFVPGEDSTVTIYRAGRGDATVEFAITDDESHHRHMRVGTRQAEIDGDLGVAIGKLSASDCRAGGS